FISGSTSAPKAVLLIYTAICSCLRYRGKSLQIGVNSPAYQYAAYTFDMSIYGTFATLNLEGTVCIPSCHPRTHQIDEFVKTLRANWAFFTPTLISTLHPSEIPGMQTVFISSAIATTKRLTFCSGFKIFLASEP
ncbi:uncharacterized protein BDR25DRAFT_204378, partial [Lindgomyces ingoldianus]